MAGVCVHRAHHRWKIIQKHPEIPYKTKEMKFSDRWAVIVWICQNQLGRRNLTDEQKTYLIGKEYEAQKQTHGGDRASSPQNDDLKMRTKNIVAKRHDVAPSTVERAEHFAHGLDAAEKVSPGFKDSILTGAVKAPKSVIFRPMLALLLALSPDCLRAISTFWI